VDLFSFAAWMLLTVVVVTIVWPLNVPLLALAIKVRRGQQPIGYETQTELWWRCAFGSLGLMVLALIAVGLSYGLLTELELTGIRGPVHLVLLLLLFAAGIPYLFWILGLEDMVEAAGIYVLYVFLPGLPLFLLGWLLSLGDRVGPLVPWLAPAAHGGPG
jgi:hypothetical protein